jgi:hypothetical protein
MTVLHAEAKFLNFFLIFNIKNQMHLSALKKIIKQMEIFEQIKALVNEAEGDIQKFYEKGNKAAGTRVRKSMQDLKKLAQDLRTHVQESKNAE